MAKKLTNTIKYLHVKSLEKFHPGYKDRILQWAKFYFNMVQGDPEFEMIDSEIDKWRFVAFVMLELQSKNPIPLENEYLKRKGFDLKKRSISLTLEALHNFVEAVTLDEKLCTIDLEEDKEKDIDMGNRYRAKPKDLNMVIEHFKEKGIPDHESNAQKFFDHYEANGWYRGKTKIKSWRHCLSQWDFAETSYIKKTQIYTCQAHPEVTRKSELQDFYAQCPKCHTQLVRI